MQPRLLLTLLTTAPRRSRAGGFSMLVGILVILALAVGSVGMANLISGGFLGSTMSNESRDARAAAEAGIDRIISTWNQPENRGLLVSNQGMSTWSASTANISPCVSNDGKATRPGAAGTGQPTATATSYADGAFRDITSGTVNTGTRQFSLTGVVVSAAANNVANRRTLTFQNNVGNGAASANDFRTLINLDDPDNTGNKQPGYNSGLLSVTVQGRVVRNGVTLSTSTVTREFQLLPKCCGASFGSNGSGGSTFTSTTAGSGIISDGNSDVSTTQRNSALGSDSRFCGLDFGVITGLGGGAHWSYYANDIYTTRNAAGTVTPLTNIIGDTSGQTGANKTTFQRSNCRLYPAPSSCPTTPFNDPASWYTSITGAALNTVGTDGDITGYNNTPRATSAQQTANKNGTMISSVPVIPAELNLPPVTNFQFTTFTAAQKAVTGTDNTYTTSEYLRTNSTTKTVQRRWTAAASCKTANANITCPTTVVGATTYHWSTVPGCAYTATAPVSGTPGFQCKGPTVDYNSTTLGNNTTSQTIVLDTSDGPLTWQYNNAAGWAPVNAQVDFVSLGTGDQIQHVECSPPSLQSTCATPIPDSTYAPLGQPDRFNIFGEAYNSSFPN
ncbi:MAG: hypothetical protein WBM08_06930, partial [Prochlorococcaceae cyanobacterium]